MITEMKWNRNGTNQTDILACAAVGGGTYYEFISRGDTIEKMRLRHKYGRRFGHWSHWHPFEKMESNKPWCDAVRAALKSFRAEEQDAIETVIKFVKI